MLIMMNNYFFLPVITLKFHSIFPQNMTNKNINFSYIAIRLVDYTKKLYSSIELQKDTKKKKKKSLKKYI